MTVIVSQPHQKQSMFYLKYNCSHLTFTMRTFYITTRQNMTTKPIWNHRLLLKPSLSPRASCLCGHQQAQWWVTTTFNLQHVIQCTVQSIGLLGGFMLIAYYVYLATKTVGDFVMFGMYLDQIFRPLDLFAVHYRWVVGRGRVDWCMGVSEEEKEYEE